MLISAAIIAKNEEGVIERCIDSAAQYADEIVLVDTGSTDATKEIASRHPKVRVFDSEHFNADTHFSDFRFGVAKNEAIRRCRGEWVIWIDADDFIDASNAEKIRRLAESTQEVCLFSFMVEYGPLLFEHCRLFRNGHNIFFDEEHSCHEYLNTLNNPHYMKRDIRVLHLPGTKHVSSGERNIAIMEKDHYERGMNDTRTLFYLANAYREAGRAEDAIKFYNKYLEISEWAEERFFARYFKAQALVIVGRNPEARAEAFRALTEDFRFAEPYCLLGDIAYKDGDLRRAQSWFQMALDTPFPEDSRLFVARPLYSEYPSARIRDCHDGLVGRNTVEEEKQARDALEKALDGERPTYSYVADVVEVIGAYLLPEDTEEAIIAASVLSVVASEKHKVYEIRHEGAKDIASYVEGLLEADGDCEPLYSPPPRNGSTRTREEWYSRSLGHVLREWGPFLEETTKVQKTLRRALHAD